MDITHLQYLKCPDCGHFDLDLKVISSIDNNTVKEGILSCSRCPGSYPIINGIGVMIRNDEIINYLNDEQIKFCNDNKLYYQRGKVDDPLLARQIQASRQWTFQWDHVEPYYNKSDLEKTGILDEENFLKSTPVKKEEYRGKKVLCCGIGGGREVLRLEEYNPELIIGIELASIVHLIPGKLRDMNNVLLLQADILNIPLKGEMDIVICDHVLHHVRYWQKGFQEMSRIVKKGGYISLCVYSKENNGIMIYLVEPLKEYFFRHMSLRLLHKIALIPALMFYFLIRCVYRPLSKSKIKLPLAPLMQLWSKNPLRILQAICFDCLHSPITYFISKKEILDLSEKDYSVKILSHLYGSLWIFLGVKK